MAEPVTPEPTRGPGRRLKETLDTLLVVDVFVVIGGALWFAAAVLLHGQHIEAPLNAFQALWQPLFTPAIGLLMAAALLSGVLGWWQRRGRPGGRGTGS
jgi:Mn2+/Fe2+ NRAMP family transporter